MSDAPTTQAEQEDAVRETVDTRKAIMCGLTEAEHTEWAGFSGCGIRQVRGSREDISLVVRWCEQAAKIPYLQDRIRSAEANAAHFRTERDQLAADLRKAREEAVKLKSVALSLSAYYALLPTRPERTLRTIVEEARRALTPDPKDAGGTAKGEEWPNGCIKPGSCSRHAGCMYAQSPEQCRHFGKDLTSEIARADRSRALDQHTLTKAGGPSDA